MRPTQSSLAIEQEKLQLARKIKKMRQLIQEARQVYVYDVSSSGSERGITAQGSLLTVKPSKIIRGGKLKISSHQEVGK